MRNLFNKPSLLSACTSIISLVLVLLVNVDGFLFAQIQQLPAPTISVENPIEVNTSELSLAWDILDDTTKYAFELCLDATCSQKVKAYSNLSYPGLTISNLENGQYFWRVSGVDENKILGQYSTPQPLLVNIFQLQDEGLSTNEKQEKLIDNPVVKTHENDSLSTMLQLPWYIYLIILAYIIFMLRTLIWYFNK